MCCAPAASRHPPPLPPGRRSCKQACLFTRKAAASLVPMLTWPPCDRHTSTRLSFMPCPVAVLRRMEGEAFAQGAVVYSAGEASTGLYIVLDGSLRKTVEDEDEAPGSPSIQGSARGRRGTLKRSGTMSGRRSRRSLNRVFMYG